MNIKRRIYNAYATGGYKELWRKSFYYSIYKMNNIKTSSTVPVKKLEFGLNTENIRDHKIIVSLTSFPPRFKKIDLCLKSLLLQKEKPDKIIVYFGNDTSERDLSQEMIAFQKYGIEYRFDNNKNLKSHKKYFYAMQEFPNDIIVTADDDVIYPDYWLSSLIHSYYKFPNAISACRVHLMRCDQNKRLMPYNYWIDQYRKIIYPSYSLFATGNSGILYPPNSIHKMAFDVNAIISLCYEADDIWLKCMSILNETKVIWVKNWEVTLSSTEKNQTTNLSTLNVNQRNNDIFLEKVMKKYSINSHMFFE